MLKMFNYRKREDDAGFNYIVDEVVAFAAAQKEGREIENRTERMKNVCEAVVKCSLTGTRFEALYEKEGAAAFKNPYVMKNSDVQENFNAIIAEIINPVLPMVSCEDFIRFFAEVHQVGWGDTARFIVHSNELFMVNEIAEGVTRGTMQVIHNDEVTVNTKNIEIVTETDWYQIAALEYDFGDFALRAARSFENYIFLGVIKALTAATGVAGAAYTAAGFTKQNWATIAQKTSAANGGSAVWAIGTLAALNNIVPPEAGLQYGLGQKIADQGYLDRFFGTRLVCLDPAFEMPYGVNVNGDLAFSDNEIYFIGMNAYKPIHIVYEGNTVVVERDATHTPDKTYRIKIGMRMGISAVLGSKFGCLTLGA